MTVNVVNKVLVVTAKNEILEPVEIALRRNNLDLVRGFMNLCSISIIRKQAAGSKSLNFFGDELYRYIREQGQPFAVVMDGSIDCGLGKEEDPQGIRLFMKALTSFMIIAKAKGFDKFRGNFLLIAGEKDRERIRDLILNPKSLLALMEEADKANTAIIESYRKNIFHFGNRFYIECAVQDGGGEIMASVERFISEIRNRENLAILKNQGAPVDKESTEPAKVIYVALGGTVYVDGETGKAEGINGQLNPGEFYILGSWTSRTQMEVSKKVSRMILKGIGDEILFSKDDRIVINIDEKTGTDATTPASIAGLLTKELGDYANLIFVTNKEKGFLMKNSPGFALIQKRVRMKG